MSQAPLPHLQLELDKLNACIHCGMCLPACPTYRATGSEAESPRGRLYLMKKMLEGPLAPDEVAPHLDNCLACHGCETVCPSGVQYGRVLMASREDLAHRNRSPQHWLKRQIFRWVLPNHALLVLGGRLLRFYQQSGLEAWIQRSGLLTHFPSLAYQAQLLPKIPAHRPLPTGQVYGPVTGEPVALLVGCVMDIFYNPVHWDTVDVLAANGYRVTIPPQTCCGALAHHAGEAGVTRMLARQNIDAMLRTNPRWIVVNSAGCGSSMKEYPHLLADDPQYAEIARAFADKVVDISELLAKKPLAPFKASLPETVTYHAACHLYHVQQVKTQPIELLKQVPGLTLVPLQNAEACCGSAGIYNVEHPDLSQEILEAKLVHLKDACRAGASTVVTGNPGCLLQLEKGMAAARIPMRVRHPVSILAQAYRENDAGSESSQPQTAPTHP